MIVVQALGDVQDALLRHAQLALDPLVREQEARGVGLVATDLLRGDHRIERDPEPLLGRGEEIVVAVRDGHEREARVQPLERLARVGKRRPVDDGASELARLGVADGRPELRRDPAQADREHLAVGRARCLRGVLEAREPRQQVLVAERRRPRRRAPCAARATSPVSQSISVP